MSYLATTLNNIAINAEEGFAAHMRAHEDVDIKHVKEAINLLSLEEEEFFFGSVEFRRTIGHTNCVEYDPYNYDQEYTPVFLAKRLGRDGETPIIFNVQPELTRYLTMGLCKKEGQWYIFTAFYGEKAEREPWDTNIESEEEQKKAEEFWDCHALCYNHTMFSEEENISLLLKEHFADGLYDYGYDADVKINGTDITIKDIQVHKTYGYKYEPGKLIYLGEVK